MPRLRRSPSGPTTFSRAHPRLDLIFNAASGKRDPTHDLSVITGTLSASFATVHVWRPDPKRDIHDLVQSALSQGATYIVACGGDGTVAAVAASIKAFQSVSNAPTPIILGLLPRGTANALCAALHIPSPLPAASRMLASGPLRRLDFPSIIPAHPSRDLPAAAISDESAATSNLSALVPCRKAPGSMLLLAGIGLEAETVRRAHTSLKRKIGAVAYAIAGLDSIWRQREFTTHLTLYGVDDALMFAQGTTRCDKLRLTGMRLQGVTIANAAPAASVLAQGIGTVRPDDGMLEVVCIRCSHPLGLIGTMLAMLRSALLRTRHQRGTVYGLRAKKVTVECDPPQPVVVDGEDAGVTPITVELKPVGDYIDVVAPKAGTVNREKRRFSRSLVRLWRNMRGVTMLALIVSLLSRSRRQ